MAAINTSTALLLMKTRLNRLATDTTLDEYFLTRINAAIEETEATGIVLNDSTAHLVYVVDYAVWQYQNRDSHAGMPEWLRLRRRELWVQQGVKA